MWRLDVSSEAELEIRDFPYGVFFTVEGDIITVLAVLHLLRHRDTWKPRRRTQ